MHLLLGPVVACRALDGDEFKSGREEGRFMKTRPFYSANSVHDGLVFMRSVLARFGGRRWMWFAGILLLSAAAVAFTLKIIPWDQLTPDFMQFWTAGKIVASGGN